MAGPVTDPLPDIVLGNLGALGTDALDATSSHLIENATLSDALMALSFVTGSDGLWQLGNVLRLGIGSPTDNPVPFALIVADADGNPDLENTPVALYVMGEEESVTTTGLYDLTRVFAGPLQASSTYWLYVVDDGDGSSFRWYDNQAEASPIAANDSGWSFGGAKRSLDGGSTWEDYSAGRTAAFSIAAVPEPATSCMALAGLACGGFSMWRRRKRA